MSNATRFSLRNLLGFGALTVTLALSLTGVEVVHAEPSAVESLASETASQTEQGGQVCAGNPDAIAGPSLNDVLGEAAVGVHSTNASDPRGDISLNHRGYNYGPPPTGPGQAVLQYEARQAR